MEKASFLLGGSVVSDGPRCQQGEPRQACDLKEVKARKARTDFYETIVWWADLM